MTPLHRHQVAWPSPAGWQRVLVREWDAPARACLQHWATHGLPLVVTRQPEAEGSETPDVALGLCAPNRWQRRRLALRLPLSELLYLDEFPALERVAAQLPAADRAAARRLPRRRHRRQSLSPPSAMPPLSPPPPPPLRPPPSRAP